MRGVVLRHELSRLASEKGADPSIVGLAKNSAALQSRLVELKASCSGWRPGIEGSLFRAREFEFVSAILPN